MDGEKKSTSPCSVIGVIGGVMGLVVVTAVVTLLIARSQFANQLCTSSLNLDTDALSSNRLSFSAEPEWDTTHRIHLDEKGVSLMLTDSADRCYVMPINRNNEPRTLALVHEPLSEEMLDHLAGHYGVQYCGDAAAYLLKEVNALEKSRQKRDAAATTAAPAATTAAPAAAAAAAAPVAAPPGLKTGWFASFKQALPTLPNPNAEGNDRASGLNLKYEERNPRCEDLILDCGKDGAIGQTQQCYTWINGVILMKQECTDGNKFKIYMSKPPGRILKIAQREWKVCIERRKEGLRC